jgi:hypothetical protein
VRRPIRWRSSTDCSKASVSNSGWRASSGTIPQNQPASWSLGAFDAVDLVTEALDFLMSD